jgi:hypothetical protein
MWDCQAMSTLWLSTTEDHSCGELPLLGLHLRVDPDWGAREGNQAHFFPRNFSGAASNAFLHPGAQK